MKWHPFAERFPMIEGQEWAEFKETIRRAGGNTEPVAFRETRDGEKEYIDGRNRSKACLELDMPCKEEQVVIDEAEVVPYILDKNLRGRRHLDKEFRKQIILELREQGMSTRDIASKTRTSPTAVHNVLKRNPPKNGVPAKIRGKDGKMRSSKGNGGGRKPDSGLCPRCTRIGKASCDACKAKPAEAPEAAKNGDVPFDWYCWDRQMAVVGKAADAVAKGYKAKDCPEHKLAITHLNDHIAVMKAWRKRLETEAKDKAKAEREAAKAKANADKEAARAAKEAAKAK